MITVKNVSKSYGDFKAVRDLSFTVASGEVVGFLGPNGAGKSTTMRLITGYMPPTSGEVLVDNISVANDPKRVRQKIGYLPESAAIYTDMTVVDYLSFMGRMRGLATAQLNERLKIVAAACQLKSVMSKKIAELSKGYRQRVGLAQALLPDPEVLILDEPTVGLDPNQISEIRELIREIGKTKTILLSTHILSEVSATCSRVIIINHGKIVAEGSPETLTASAGGKRIYRVISRAPLGDWKSTLQQALPSAVIEASQSDDGRLESHITVDGNFDAAEAIFGVAAARGFVLSHLSEERLSLEDVFQQLTK